jgi:hypothetical protein
MGGLGFFGSGGGAGGGGIGGPWTIGPALGKGGGTAGVAVPAGDSGATPSRKNTTSDLARSMSKSPEWLDTV